MKLLKTGIAGLDEFLQGGLPPRVFLLLGSPGSGSEIFARQVANFRAKQVGVTYFTVTRTVECVKDDMSAFGWQVSSLEQAGNWRFASLQSRRSGCPSELYVNPKQRAGRTAPSTDDQRNA
jgi:KaiC/GvpD/RAD55 family RecA-like ATPase